MRTPLPSPRTLLTSLFSNLPSSLSNPAKAPNTSNILKDGPPATKRLFLTLHCLFPNEFLPALDLLDRQLITRTTIGALGDENDRVTIDDTRASENVVYYVRSSQPTRASRYQSTAALGGATSYEVRLEAWNCSCPAFTFSAFSNVAIDRGVTDYSKEEEEEDEDNVQGQEWRVGGLMVGKDGMPVCKHLLACVLVERCGLLSGFREEKVIGRAEAAGLGAGWGG
ncbi:MAG: hypothetical protein M1830_002831 [Pleopsidium flavum]|nr:MAG: hypothetical protein M1830_002831 [Pleopsidium flavum]